MPVNLKPDSDQSDFVDGVDRHFYQNQVGPSSPFDDTHGFRLATAIAKDRARHQLIRAVRKADQDARYNSFTGLGNDSISDVTSISRSIDGVERAPDEAIKL